MCRCRFTLCARYSDDLELFAGSAEKVCRSNCKSVPRIVGDYLNAVLGKFYRVLGKNTSAAVVGTASKFVPIGNRSRKAEKALALACIF